MAVFIFLIFMLFCMCVVYPILNLIYKWEK
jgi:hypothetical protein